MQTGYYQSVYIHSLCCFRVVDIMVLASNGGGGGVTIWFLQALIGDEWRLRSSNKTIEM